MRSAPVAVRVLVAVAGVATPACDSGFRGDDASDGGTAGDAGGDSSFTWTTAAPCPLARFEANGAVVDGALWVMGGFTSAILDVTARVDIYDPVADAWRAGPELPGAETHFAVVPVGHDVIVAGGFAGAFRPRPDSASAVWWFDGASGQWTIAPSLPTAVAGVAWALVGTQLHVAGGLGPDGNTDIGVHYVWDIAGADGWVTAADLPNPRNHGSGAASGGLFYAIAGRHKWDETAGDVADVNAFDPTTGAWTARAPIPSARSEIGASTTALPDGRIVVVGGSVPGIRPSADVFVYEPTANAWTTLSPLPEKRKGAVTAVFGDKLIVTTGSPTSTDPSDATFVGCCL